MRKTLVGFQFWSLFHGLGPMVWYYPMNELEISGYEVFVLAWLSPIILVIPPLRYDSYKITYKFPNIF